jgi:uncharacterized membrane protein
MAKEEISFGKIMAPFRLSIVGALKGPHLFDIVAFIGKEKAVQRIEQGNCRFKITRRILLRVYALTIVLLNCCIFKKI